MGQPGGPARRRSILVTTIVAAIMVASVTVANAAPGAAIFACVNNNSGEIKIASGPWACKSNERELTWQAGAIDLSGIFGRLDSLQQQIAGLLPMPGASGGTPGATIVIGSTSTFTDPPTGFKLYVDGTDISGPAGEVTLLAQGPLSFCSTHGVFVNGSSASDGLLPLQKVQCGKAGGQTVSISGCNARISVHGYMHTDDPLNYMGMTTLDLSVTQTAGASAGTFQLVAYTPRGKLTRGGAISDVHISSCT